MHAHTTLALSLSAALAYAKPAHYDNSTTVHNYNETVHSTTTLTTYLTRQETHTVHAVSSHAPEDKHVADLHSQISSLKAQLSSQREASATLCYAPAKTSAAPTSHKGNHGGAPGNPSATHEAANWSFFKTAHMSRLPATSTLSYDYTSTASGSQKQTGSPDSYPSKPAGYDGKPSASGVVTNAPQPYPTSYNNGTASYYGGYGGTGGLSTGVTTSLSPTYIPKLEDYSIAEIESGDALEKVSQVATHRLQERPQNGTCTFENARVRTEFRKMSNQDRKSFTDAIMCLKQVPTTADATAYPGVKSRYDEYVATHINMTMSIHVTADFLAWHRNFIWEWENDLINTCGYTGSLPYWDWSRDAQAPHESELFNGDEFSLGSDGVFIEGRDDTYLGLMDITFPPGTGGGCVHSGPFSGGDFSNLGPLDSPYGDNVENEYDFNPRCLVRDLNSYFSSRYNTYANVTQLVLGQTNIQYFQAEMQGFVGDNKLGIHGAGHWLGGGPSQVQDFHSSPNDPVFFLHHAQVDRVWAIWQALDAETRQNAIYGTSTLNDSPPSPVKQLTDSIAFGFTGENEIFGDLMDTLGGKFCYRYE
jgi:tyrosinase